MERMNEWRRSVYAGTLRSADIEKTVILMGWVQKARDLGALYFFDIRDREGIAQIVVESQNNPSLYEKVKGLHQEDVVAVQGVVRERSAKNPDIATGDVEVLATDVRILDCAKTPPIYIKDEDDVREDLRLSYRYLDLRKPKMQKMLRDRAEIVHVFRDFLHEHGFIEVETPFLGRSTPEGARDYLVPSRLSPNTFYALPQSPQLYKQLLMIGGTDRYYQIARCFRDEDLRANRQPEFTQVDIEMSFIDMEDVLSINEELVCQVFEKIKGIQLQRPFARLSYEEAMSRYGSDKPDLRYGMEIHDVTAMQSHMDFGLFNDAVARGEHIYGLRVEGKAESLTRKKLDRLTKEIQGKGAAGMLWYKKQGEIQSSFNKFRTDAADQYLQEEFELQDQDVLVFLIGEKDRTLELMGMLRSQIAAEYLDLDPDTFAITWVVDFPMFEYDAEEDRYVAKHHPFTAPRDEDLDLLEQAPEKVRAKAYDLVINGEEAGGGSIRIHQSDVQQRVFRCLKMDDQTVKEQFGFLVEALQYGTPPHGGIAYGLDRLVMQLLAISNIRDVIAFPKTQSASDLLTGAPSGVRREQLEELHLLEVADEKHGDCVGEEE